jgi:hypothetical protein
MVVLAYNRNKEVVVTTKPRSNMLFTHEKIAHKYLQQTPYDFAIVNLHPI